MVKQARIEPTDAILLSDGEAESSECEIIVMKSSRKRSAPSSQSSKSRGVSEVEEVEENNEGLPAAKKKTVADKTSGRMFMVSVEGLLIYPR